MRSQRRFLSLPGLLFLAALGSYGATITGTVKGTEGAPFQGAFVEAQNTKSRITTIVLSDSQGRYRIEKLPAGEYRLQIRAVGFRTDPQTGVSLAADQKASYDFALQKGVVRWNDISFYQAIASVARGERERLVRRALCDVPSLSDAHGFGDARRRWVAGPAAIYADNDARGRQRSGCRCDCVISHEFVRT